jgi:hypothetical protein
MFPDARARSEYCKSLGPVVAKNVWWWADCKRHGRQAHHSQLGGACERCHHERLEAAGLLERRR